MGFEQTNYAVLESEGEVTVCVRINASLERSVTVNLSTIAMTAEGSQDPLEPENRITRLFSLLRDK